MLSDISGLELQIDDSKNEHLGSVTERVPDIAKIASLGYSPKINFLEGLTKTYNWYQKNYHLYEEEKINIWANNRPNAIKLFKERFINHDFIKITSPYEEKRK